MANLKGDHDHNEDDHDDDHDDHDQLIMLTKCKAKSGLGGVAGTKAGNETRPINVRVVWIIKCW